MLKVFNISTLLLFVCFLFAPTISFALNKDINTASLVLAEEEENHSKTKKNNNNLNEEEKEVHYSFVNQFNNILLKNRSTGLKPAITNHSIKDDLVFKIPLPPPEQNL